MAAKSNFLENMLIDGFFRGGALTSAGAAGSSAIVRGIWTASTAYSLGDVVVPHGSMVAGGGKFLRCTVAGTSGSVNTLTVPNPGVTLTDNSVTWTACSGIPVPPTLYVGLFTVTPSDTGGGTEVSGGSYARVAATPSLANFAGTQSAGSTTASTGTGGTTSNNASITFPAATADWGTAVAVGIFDAATGGNLLFYGALTSNQAIPSGVTASYAAGTLSFQEDN
jgi:hypothetical protein